MIDSLHEIIRNFQLTFVIRYTSSENTIYINSVRVILTFVIIATGFMVGISADGGSPGFSAQNDASTSSGGSGDREAIAVDGSGNVYVSGHHGTVRYNSAGQEQWVAGGPVDAAIAVDALGNAYVTGYTIGQNGRDYLTIKYNSAGQEQWEARYNSAPGDSPDQPNAIAVDNLGNCYVTGESDGVGTTSDYPTIKYNSAGQEQWVARYDGPASYVDGAYAIALDALGNVYVTGYSFGVGNVSEDYATIKYNSAGRQQWVVRYNGPAGWDDDATAIAVDSLGNVYVTGSSATANDGPPDYATVKYNSFGQQQWVTSYNGLGNSEHLAMP